MTPRYDIDATAQGRMLAHMLALQNRMNAVVNPAWAHAGYRWSRAILVEGVELLEHYNRWKWWKKTTTPDLAQCRLELVDIFHFALSYWMVRFGSTDARDWVLNEAVMRRIVRAQQRAESVQASDEAFNAAVDALVGSAAQDLFDTDAFFALCAMTGLSFEMLYGQYLGKNLLNVFRQHHGYKTGRYLKEWDGMEDNVVLEQVMAECTGLTGEALEAGVGERLLARYTQACQAAAWHCLETDQGPVLGRLRSTSAGSVLTTASRGEMPVSDVSALRPLPVLEP